MTRSYCTLFDKNYLYQGLALYLSLARNARDFRLYALCMDSTAHRLLTNLRLADLVPVALEDLLTPEIARLRERTTHGQFCWASQPLVCGYVLDRYGVDLVTYLEADSMFFSSPEPLFEEMGSRSVTLVPHNYLPGLDNTEVAGRFCVQFNAFRNDAVARKVLEYWRECCFEYDKSAPTLYPGQTSLDEWPERFEGVAVLENPGAGVAPWNVAGYRVDVRDSIPYVDSRPTVFFHYHQYGRFKTGGHELGCYPLTVRIIDAFYRPYVRALREAEQTARRVDPGFDHRRVYEHDGTLASVVRSVSKQSVAACLDALKRRARGRYNVYPDEYFRDDGRSSAGS